MKMQVKNADVSFTLNGDYRFTLEVPRSEKTTLLELLNITLEEWPKYRIEVSKEKKARSQNANAYLWVLCKKIGDVILLTKDEVYQWMVREKGSFKALPIREDAVDHWKHIWSMKGLGWFCEEAGHASEGYVNVLSYYGSSVYDTQEMSRLIDHTVSAAKDLGIETLPPDEIERMKEKWRAKNG